MKRGGLFLRFLAAFLGAPALVAGVGALLARVPSGGLQGFGAILLAAVALAGPVYLLAGGPLAWRATAWGQTSRQQAVILALLANFAALAIWPAILWAMGPLKMSPELAAGWGDAIDASQGGPPPFLFGAAVFLGGVVFAPLFALLAHALGRLTGAVARDSAS